MAAFEFATAARIVFGAGSLGQVGALVAPLGTRALVVGGSQPARLAPLLERLRAAGLATSEFSVAGEPTLALVQQGVALAREAGCDVVVAMGGGSAIDAGKAIAALVANPGDPLDYLEVVGRGQALPRPPLPCVAIPTTAGTGAEATRNAVLGVPEQRVKVSLRSPLMLPRLALVDPELTYALPPAVTASTGMDALTQCLEPLVSSRANPLADGFAREGLRRASWALGRAYANGSDAEAREAMAVASLCGGLALANAGLGVVHGFAGPLGGMLDAPHGALCARLLPPAMAANVRALRERDPESAALERYTEAARILTGDVQAQADDGVLWVGALVEQLGIARLGSYGLAQREIAEVVAKARQASSMKANPIALTDAELAGVLEQAL
jgi:alcohol dehydrogenase class IV